MRLYEEYSLVAGIGTSTKLIVDAYEFQRTQFAKRTGSNASCWRRDRIARGTRVVPRDNVSQRFATRVSKRWRNFASLMKTGGIGPQGVRRQVYTCPHGSLRIHGNARGTNSSLFGQVGL